MASWALAACHATGGRFQFSVMLRRASRISLLAASDLTGSALVANHLACRGIQALNGVGGVDDLRDFGREGDEWDHRFPVVPQALGEDREIVLAPDSLVKVLQRPLSFLRLVGPIDRLAGHGDGLALLPGGKPHRVADQVHNAGLHHGVGEDRRDGFREPFRPSATAIGMSLLPRP